MSGQLTRRRVRSRPGPRAARVTVMLPALVVAALAVAAVPSTAISAPAVPGAEPVVLLEAPAGEFCAFALRLSLLDGTKLHSADSALFSTGPLSVTVTNLDTGVAQTFNASGPTFKDGTLKGTAIIAQPLSRNVGPAFLILNRGVVTFTPNNTIATIKGNQVGICAELT